MTKLKVLSVCEFDPAGVLGGHRSALRAMGVDYRLAVMDIYPTGREMDHDYQATRHDAEVADFAEEADIIQFHPGIGQPWSYTTMAPNYKDGADWFFGSIDWSSPRFQRAKRISYFHGSRNAAKNAALYAKHWRERGHVIWASTIDYVHWMEAVYAPPIVNLTAHHPLRAKLREDDEPLMIAHAPTDPQNCNTPEFIDICQRRGILYDFIFNVQHPEVLRRKVACNAGFDHLRGSFSVNTVENCLMGLVPLVGLKHEYLRTLNEEIGFHRGLFPVETAKELGEYIVNLDEDTQLTRDKQAIAHSWALDYWSAGVLGPKLLAKYQDVLR